MAFLELILLTVAGHRRLSIIFVATYPISHVSPPFRHLLDPGDPWPVPRSPRLPRNTLLGGALWAQGLEVYVLRFRVQGLCFFLFRGLGIELWGLVGSGFGGTSERPDLVQKGFSFFLLGLGFELSGLGLSAPAALLYGIVLSSPPHRPNWHPSDETSGLAHGACASVRSVSQIAGPGHLSRINLEKIDTSKVCPGKPSQACLGECQRHYTPLKTSKLLRTIPLNETLNPNTPARNPRTPEP